jgi:hypothetical protein
MNEITQERSILGKLADNPAASAARTRKLDYDRGLMMNVGRGGAVAMYFDQPGTYYNEAGLEVSEAEARTAGFNTLLHGAEKRKKEARDKAFANIEAQHKAELAAIEAQANALELVPEAASAPEATVYAVPSKDADSVAADVLLANREKKA